VKTCTLHNIIQLRWNIGRWKNKPCAGCRWSRRVGLWSARACRSGRAARALGAKQRSAQSATGSRWAAAAESCDRRCCSVGSCPEGKLGVADLAEVRLGLASTAAPHRADPSDVFYIEVSNENTMLKYMFWRYRRQFFRHQVGFFYWNLDIQLDVEI